MTESKPSIPLRAIVQMAAVVFVMPLIPIIISGKWDWWEVWVYAVFSSISFVISRILAARRHPDLIVERSRFMAAKDTKPWDMILAPLLAFGSIFILVVAGLDRLYGWSNLFSVGARIAALVAIMLGYAFSSWALIENRFFSGTVRIQTERGHHVVSSGPYRIMRHPGYAGALLGYLPVPILLNSLWAFIPAILLLIVLVVRTALEDKTLQAELPGYREFAQKTRYRLLPGIW